MRFLGTTWEKIEGKFLLSTSGSGGSGQLGGSNTKTITQANLPNIKLQVDSFSLGRGTQEITGEFSEGGSLSIGTAGYSNGALYSKTLLRGGYKGDSSGRYSIGFQASRSWTGMSTSASPYTSSLGSGTPLDITPAYYTVHIWKRLS